MIKLQVKFIALKIQLSGSFLQFINYDPYKIYKF